MGREPVCGIWEPLAEMVQTLRRLAQSTQRKSVFVFWLGLQDKQRSFEFDFLNEFSRCHRHHKMAKAEEPQRGCFDGRSDLKEFAT